MYKKLKANVNGYSFIIQLIFYQLQNIALKILIE